MLKCLTIDKSLTLFMCFNLFSHKYVTNYAVFIYPAIYLCILMFKEASLCKRISKKNVYKLEVQGPLGPSF